MMRAEYTCDVCGITQMLEVSNAPGDPIPSSPPDWVFLTWQEQVRVIPPALDAAADAAYDMPGNIGSWMEATMSRAFATEFHICTTCRAKPLHLAELAQQRLRERQERATPTVSSAPAPFAGATVVPLHAGIVRPAPPVDPEPPPKPYADCPLWSDSTRIGVLGHCKDPACLKAKRCKNMPESPLVFIHEVDGDTAKPADAHPPLDPPIPLRPT